MGEKKLVVSSFPSSSKRGDNVNIRSWLLIFGMTGLIVLFWFVAGGVALRYFVLFIGVMSCMYVVWDVIGQCATPIFVKENDSEKKYVDDTLARKVNGSDASEFARICGCCPSRGLFHLSLILGIN